jgi:hypothetical protein
MRLYGNMFLKIGGIDLANSIVGAHCELLLRAKVDSRFLGNDYFRDSRLRGNDGSLDSRLRGMSYTLPFPVRGEEFGVRIPDSAWDENDARISNHPLAQFPIAPSRHHTITQSPYRFVAQSPGRSITQTLPSPITRSPDSNCARDTLPRIGYR